jgi:ankyrin repeat protein
MSSDPIRVFQSIEALCYGAVDILEETLRLLLEHDQGAVLKADQRGRLPLHFASQYCSSTVVEIVYNAYPEAIFIRDNDGETPLDMASDFDNQDVVAFFDTQLEFVREAREIEMPNKDGELPIHQAFRNENVAKGTIKLMAAANPLIAINGQGRTPLHIAFVCGFDDLDNVKSLVEINEACLTIGDSNQNLPLHIACRFGKSDVVNYILDKTDCGVGVKNDDGVAPFEC